MHSSSSLRHIGFLLDADNGSGPSALSGPLASTSLLVVVACACLSAAILAVARRRLPARYGRAAALVASFIFVCGLLQATDLWSIWQPAPVVQAIARALAAALGVTTAVIAWRLPVGVEKAPSIDALEEAVRALQSEVDRRKSAEQHAEDVEQTLAVTLASIDTGLIATDADGNVTRMNAVAEQITGLHEASAIGRSYWEVFVREDRPPLESSRTVVERLAQAGLTIETAHRVRAVSPSGAITPVEVKGELKYAADGSIRGMLALIKDMSGVDRVEGDLRRLAAIVESSNDVIVGKTLDGRITSWNRAASDLFGYTAEEVLGRSVQMLIPPDRREEEMEILASIFDGKVVAPFETVRVTKDGRRIDLSVTISPIRDGSGRIVGGSKIARDISAQRQMVAALRESEARLRFALEVAGIGDWELDLRTGAMHRSLRHDQFFGYDALQPEWRIATLLAHVHPEDRDAVALSYRRGLLRTEDWCTEFRCVWPDQSIHWLRIHGSTRYDTGDSNRMLGIVSDVTQQRLAEESRMQAQRLEIENRQIQESNRLKSQFLANMSHELRSPLNAIIGFSDLLCTEGMVVEPAQQRQFIGHIRTSGRHLLQLINDVLDMSKVESGKFDFYPEPVDLAALIGEVRGVMFSLLQARHQTLRIDVAPAVAKVVTDPARLKQALFNYLSNAIKFTPDGGEICVRAFADGSDRFRVEVRDVGAGIDPADLSRLFVEFQQLDAGYTKRHQGTGLGLALTRRLVQAQGGEVGVHSVPGQGSVFHLVLPLSPVSTVPLADGEALPGRAGAHFLVIEDDLDGRARIADALTVGGHRVDMAANAAQAVQQAQANGYDALTVDLMLAWPGGLGALAGIRSISANARAPVLAITLGDEASGLAGFAVADVIAKPLQVSEVIQAMTHHGLARRRGVQVAVIDDDPVARDLMRATLGDLGIETLCFESGSQALDALQGLRPAAIVLDLIMPGMNGFEVLERLRNDAQWRDALVFVWTSMALTRAQSELLASSASAILLKGGGDFEFMLERLRRSPTLGRPETARVR